MNKQIEDIARVLSECCNIFDEQGRHVRDRCSECEYWSSENFYCCSYNTKEAEALYNAGYRRQDEVAREIFVEIEYYASITIDEYGFHEFFKVHCDKIAELKKKYGVQEDATN